MRKIRPEDGAAGPAGTVAQAFVPVFFFLEGDATAKLTRNTGKNACATNRSLTRAALFAACRNVGQDCILLAGFSTGLFVLSILSEERR